MDQSMHCKRRWTHPKVYQLAIPRYDMEWWNLDDNSVSIPFSQSPRQWRLTAIQTIRDRHRIDRGLHAYTTTHYQA